MLGNFRDTTLCLYVGLYLGLSTLATSCTELTHWKRLWCWEGLGAGGEGDDRGWDGWMASLTWWTWVWVNSRSWWWTRRPGVLRFMGSQRVGHDWATELNWKDYKQFLSTLVSPGTQDCKEEWIYVHDGGKYQEGWNRVSNEQGVVVWTHG